MMINIIEYKPNEQNINQEFKDRLLADFELCGFNKELVKGFLFFMGSSITVEFNSNFMLKDKTTEEVLALQQQAIGLFSTPSGDFGDFGFLNDGFFSKKIYSVNHILHKVYNNEDFDKYLSKIESISTSIIAGKTELDNEFINKYLNTTHSLNSVHNLLEDFFISIGKYLDENNCSNEDSFDVGFNYLILKSQLDVKGFSFLVNSILQSFPPLYMALKMYFPLQVIDKKLLESHHLISNILQVFFGNSNPKITQPIHLFHQYIFYQPGELHLREMWDFKGKEEDLLLSIFHNALEIRNTYLYKSKPEFLQSDIIFNSELKGMSLKKQLFSEEVQKIIYTKYNIAFNRNVEWNNRGDFIQYLCILFYETTIHAMVLDEIE